MRWILKLDVSRFSPELIFDELVKHLTKDESAAGAGVGFCTGRAIVSKNWIPRFLDQHPMPSIKFASRIDLQRACSSNPLIINDHLKGSAKSHPLVDSLQKPLQTLIRRVLS